MREHEAIIEKVRKLLNMANCKNVNQHEGQTAIVKAQLLLKKHNLSLADVDNDLAEDHDVVDAAITKFKLHQWWEKSLAHTIGDNFRCTAYVREHDMYSKIYFIGMKSDVDIAEQIYLYAAIHMKETGEQSQRHTRLNNYNIDLTGYLDNYYRGYLRGLNEKFIEQLEQDESLALAIVKSAEVIKKVEEKGLLEADRVKLENNHLHKNAFKRGYINGKEFDRNRQSIEDKGE